MIKSKEELNTQRQSYKLKKEQSSWNENIDHEPNNIPYPKTITLTPSSSVSSITTETYPTQKKTQNKVEKFLKHMETRNTIKDSNICQRVDITKPSNKVTNCRHGKQTRNKKALHDFGFTTISTNHMMKKKLSKTASLIGRLKTTTSLFIKKLKDKKRQRKKQERVKEISRQESKTNLRSTRNAYTFHHSDHSSNSSSDKSSSFYPSSNESNNISNDSNYKYKFISKNECAQSKSSSSSHSVSIDCVTKYIKNKVESFIKQSEQHNCTIETNKQELKHNSKNSTSQTKYPYLQFSFPITEINIPSPQIPFTNLSSLNIKDNSLFHPLRHQQGIWTPSRLQKYYPLYFNIPEITQPIHHPSPDKKIFTPNK